MEVKVRKENFRIVPNGKIIGVLFRGTILEEVESKEVKGSGKWYKVKVTGWIWGKSVLSREEKEGKTSPLPGKERKEKREIEITSWRWFTRGGNTYVVGIVKNNSSQVRRFLKVVAIFKNEKDEIVDTDYSYIEDINLEPGETSPFKLTIFQVNPEFKKCELKLIEEDIFR